MKKSHKTAVITLVTIAVLFIGLLVFTFVQTMNQKELVRRQVLTQEQITKQDSQMGQMNYFYIGAIVVGVIGGYFLFRSDMHAKKTGQQIMIDSRPSKRR